MPFTAVTGFAENADNKLNTDIVEIQASGVSGGGAIVGTGSGLATPSGGVDMEVEDSTITPTQTPIVIEETQTPEETESPNNVIWDFDESTGTLTISGTGTMEGAQVFYNISCY